MENEPQIESVPSVGQRLHEAETAIGVGRRAVAELLKQEPVDEDAVALAREGIRAARLARNDLRRELERSRPVPAYKSTWLY